MGPEVEYKCPRCHGNSFYKKDNGNQIGLYCKRCNRWIKWITKTESQQYNYNDIQINDEQLPIDNLPNKLSINGVIYVKVLK